MTKNDLSGAKATINIAHGLKPNTNACGALFVFIVLLLASSCKNFLEVEAPNTKILSESVFADDAAANGAIAGLYLDLYSESSFAGGGNASVGALAGMSADELSNDLLADQQFLNFEKNSVSADNASILTLWTSMYKGIYQANAILEGLEISNKVSSTTSNQLKGEAFFIRAFCNFYLVNIFGDVPLVLTTDYKVNALISKSPVDKVFAQIEADLLVAERLMSVNYVTEGRSRPNKFSVTAMLSRYYLYTGDWQRAREKASQVIAQDIYAIPSDLNSIFLAKSVEAIWQLQPPDGVNFTNEGYYFGRTFRPTFLTNALLIEFEPNDKRRVNWIKDLSSTVHLANKYKKSTISGSQTDEYSTVLRLAEQYLIRAEANAKQDRLSESITDVDVIRKRAGLTLLQNTNPGIGRDDLLHVIEKERRLELMTEWGHRWFDLKRTGRANQVLASVKAGWDTTDQLYPLPEQELRRNPNIKPQNTGY